MERVRRQAKQYLATQRKESRWQKVVTGLAGVVVFCTTYALILPAITMTTPLQCEIPEHVHTEECYTVETVTRSGELTCELAEAEGHTHSESCGAGETEELTCAFTEGEGHSHDEGCYVSLRGELICTETEETVEREVTREVPREISREVSVDVERERVDENGETVVETETVTELVTETVMETVTETVTESIPHAHSDSCYEWSEELSCTLEEREGHSHGEACFETVTREACTLEEREGHSHSESCYAEGAEETEELRTLTCALEEHTHDDNCYLALELEEKIHYYCGFLMEHTHVEECFFEDGELKCNIPEHTHVEQCLEEPLPEPEAVELQESFTAESEDGAVLLTLRAEGIALVPQTEGEETGFQLAVTQSEDMEAYDEYASLAAEDGEVMMVGALDYTLTYNGEAVDLTGCEVSLEVEPTQAFQEMLDSPEDLGLMTLELEGETAEEKSEAMELHFKAYTQRRGTVGYSVTQGANVVFYVQYYAWMDRLVTANGSGTALDVMDTSRKAGGSFPEKGATSAVVRNIYVKADGQVETQRILTEIYKRGEEGGYDPRKGSRFEYFDAPGLQYFNMVSNVQDIQYRVHEIWIQKGGQGDPTSTEAADWLVLPYEEGVTRFTNRPETAQANENYILVEGEDVIRLIYDPQQKDEVFPADFYDYDISDGTHGVGATNMITSRDGKNFGINGGDIPWGKARFAFGNANTGTTESLKNGTDSLGNLINQRNASGKWPNRVDITFKGGAYGLVKGMNEQGNDVFFDDDIVGPVLFGGGAQEGKTLLQEIDGIQFSRVGDTYTLTQIPGTVARELDSFRLNSGVWSNDFWPMDSASTWGAKGHDIIFGKKDVVKRANDGQANAASLPYSDDGKDHNGYFGMNFAVDFELTKNYIGPLEYYFFGDDDMWVFLSQVEKDGDGNETLKGSRQIVDIGGVHPSAGQYVDLWDYISTDEWAPDTRVTYRLTFFYTERGASGSTCWMQYTLPTVVGVDLETQIQDLIEQDTGTIRIEKQMGGMEDNTPFRFTLGLDGADNYEIQYLHRDPDGQISTSDRDGGDAIGNDGIFELEPGEILVIHHLPENTRYTITEVGEFKQGYRTEIHTVVGENGEEKVERFGADVSAVTSGAVTPGKLTWVTFINTADYELPATGGSGTTFWYTMGVLTLMGAAFLMYKKKQWSQREGEGVWG